MHDNSNSSANPAEVGEETGSGAASFQLDASRCGRPGLTTSVTSGGNHGTSLDSLDALRLLPFYLWAKKASARTWRRGPCSRASQRRSEPWRRRRPARNGRPRLTTATTTSRKSSLSSWRIAARNKSRLTNPGKLGNICSQLDRYPVKKSNQVVEMLDTLKTLILHFQEAPLAPGRSR